MIYENNYILPTQPQNTWQIIKTAVSIWKNTFFQIIIFSVINVLFSNIFLLNPLLLKYFSYTNKYTLLALSIGFFLIICIVNCITNISIIYRIDQLINNKFPTFSQILLISCKRLLPFMSVSIIYVLSTLLGTLLLIIPGIMVSIYLCLVFYLIIIENNITVINAVKLSYKLIHGRWWHTSWVISIILLCCMLAIILILVVCLWLSYILINSSILGNLLNLENIEFLKSNFKHVSILFTSIINIFTTPLLHGIMLAVLYDLKIRNKREIL